MGCWVRAMRLSRRNLLQIAAGAVLSAVPCFASAQAYPTRPVRIVVGFPPGAPVDRISRVLGEKLAAKWGQPVVVENRPGATGNIGVELVARADPDGYTLLFTPPTVVINPLLNPKLPFDASKLTPVTVIASFPNVLVVHPKVSAASVQELIALVRENPDRLNYASSGNGSTAHLTAELFKLRAGGLKITHVPYKGGGPLMSAILAGEADMLFFTPDALLSYVRAGRLKALAVLSERRIAALPDVPAMGEAFPGFVSITWWGVLAPPRTPMPIAERLSGAIAESLKQPDVAKHLADASADPIGNRPAEMAIFLREETERWAAVIRSADIKPD
jgi:tripartite-type tricarboxylate transporter receptor subunit TctC